VGVDRSVSFFILQLFQREGISDDILREVFYFQEKTVGHQGVKMGMPTGVISEGLDCDDDSRNTGFLAQGELKEFRQTFYRALAEPAQQFTVVEKELAQDFGDGKNVLAVGHGIENRLLKVVTKLDHLLVMAIWLNTLTCQLGSLTPGSGFLEFSDQPVFYDQSRDSEKMAGIAGNQN
jgi:hypothetical protein